MRTRVFLAAALALATAGCGSARPSTDDYVSVASAVVEFADRDARSNVPGPPAPGPLLLDVRSFVRGGHSVARETLDPEQLGPALADAYRPASIEEVLLCDDNGFGCWVREYGVYVTLNLARRSQDGMLAIVRTSTTDRSSFPTHVCNRYWTLRFQQDAAGAWTMVDRSLNATC